MRFLLVTLFILPLFAFGQIDTIRQKNYTSYYSRQYKCPLMVVYRLYKGGGDCDRALLHFKTGPFAATSSDYGKCGYDAGHMCPAEDFAYDCLLQKLTFSYYNCAPQTANLNRGIWRAAENKVRLLSQKDSLLVMSGAVFNAKPKHIGKAMTPVYVPTYYWKVVQSLTTKQVLMVQVFTNTSSAVLKPKAIDAPMFKAARTLLVK